MGTGLKLNKSIPPAEREELLTGDPVPTKLFERLIQRYITPECRQILEEHQLRTASSKTLR